MNRDEVTELAENNAALEAEETKSTEAPEVADAQEETTENQGAAPASEEAAPVSEEAVSEGTPENTPAEGATEGESTSAPEAAEATQEEAAEEVAALPTRDADGFSISEQDEEEERKQVENGNEYEVIFAVRSGDQQLVEDSSQRVRALIEETFEGAIDNVRASEVRRFAYPIKKQTEGVYVVVNARFQAVHTDELDRFFKFEENVLRHMVLKIGE